MIKKNIYYSFLQHILVYLKGLIILPIITTNLGVESYGVYILYISLISFYVGLSMMGVNFSVTRYLPSSEKISEKQINFYTPLYFNLLIFFITIPIIYLTYDYLMEPIIKVGIEIPFLVTGLFVLFNILYWYIPNYFRFTHRIHIFSLTEIIRPYSEILLIVVFLMFYKLTILNILTISISVLFIICVFLFIKIFKEIGITKIKLKKDKLKHDIQKGLPITLGWFVDVLIALGDRFVIGYLLSATAVGIYNASYVVGTIILLVPKALGVALPQIMAKYYDNGDTKKMEKLVETSIYIHLGLVIPFILGTIFYAHDILLLFLDSNSAESGYLITILVSVSMLFYGINLIIGNYLSIILKTTYVLKANLVAVVLNILLNVVGILIFQSILVAAITTLISYLVATLYLYKHIKFVNIRYIYFFLYFFLIGTVNYVFYITTIHIDYEYNFFIGIAITLLTYIVLIYFNKNNLIKIYRNTIN